MRVAICDDENVQLAITKTSLEAAYKSLDVLPEKREMHVATKRRTVGIEDWSY